MHRAILLGLILLAFPRAAPAAISDEVVAKIVGEFEARNYGGALPYHLLKPREITPGQRYPLIVWLHGMWDPSMKNAGQYELITDANRAAHPCYFLALDGAHLDVWDSGEFDRLVGCLNELVRAEAVDGDRLLVTGASMGGAGTCALISLHPEVFAAAAPLCGFIDSRFDPARITVPTWFAASVDDHVVPVENSDRQVAALRRLGRSVIYSHYDTGRHWPQSVLYQDPSFIAWLFAQRRGAVETGIAAASITTWPAKGASDGTIAGTAVLPEGVAKVSWLLTGDPAIDDQALAFRGGAPADGTTTWSVPASALSARTDAKGWFLALAEQPTWGWQKGTITVNACHALDGEAGKAKR